jgi:hypothetical protein
VTDVDDELIQRGAIFSRELGLKSSVSIDGTVELILIGPNEVCLSNGPIVCGISTVKLFLIMCAAERYSSHIRRLDTCKVSPCDTEYQDQIEMPRVPHRVVPGSMSTLHDIMIAAANHDVRRKAS